jgi:pyridoxamine 5'-phosphate oxidase
MRLMSSPNDILAALRKSYERAELDETSSAPDPLMQFERWLAEAIDAQLPEPNAMTLATVGGDLRPSTRIVLIKGYDARGIVWYTNYDSRPLDSRVGAWASPQSQVISGRDVLVKNAAIHAAKYLLSPPRPPHWGGYRLVPDRWEFWQGRKSRLHDRLRYRREDGAWVRERLAP